MTSEIFDHAAEYILEDDRVLLRPLNVDDFGHLLPFSLNEPELWKYSLVTAEGADGLRNYLQIALDAKASGKEYPFVVYDKLSKEYAGSTRFYDINMPFQTIQLGYTWYGRKFQRTGLNRHCKFLLMSFAFDRLGIERVELRADSQNARSIAAMQAIGCTIDGVLRSNMPTRDPGRRRSSTVLSVLRNEWYGSVKDYLQNLLT